MTKKKTYFELMRIIACALVIFNHLHGYTLYYEATGLKQFVYMIPTMITKINVPLFFMISGALLLNREEDLKTVLEKRVTRIVLVLVFFTAVIHFTTPGVWTEESNPLLILLGFVRNLMGKALDWAAAYWYLYAYLGFLFLLPFLQRAVKNMGKQEFYALLILHFVSSTFLPILNVLLSIAGIKGIGLTSDFYVPFAFVKAFFYPIVGYYLEHKIESGSVKGKHIALLGVAAMVGIVISNFCTLYDGKVNGEFSQRYVQLFDYVTAIAVFMIIKYVFCTVYAKRAQKDYFAGGTNVTVSVAEPQTNEGKVPAVEKIISFVGSLTFGIYLIDPILQRSFGGPFTVWAEPILPTMIVSALWVILSMLTGGLITFVLKHIPGIKKLL